MGVVRAADSFFKCLYTILVYFGEKIAPHWLTSPISQFCHRLCIFGRF